jgi:anti-anti-sigma factor
MEEPSLKIDTGVWQSWHIITIQGKFVIKNIAEIRKVLEPLKGEGRPKIALDLTKTTHLDSSAMTLMLNFQGRLKENGGNLVVFGANEDITGIINIVGFDSFVPMFRTRADFDRSVALDLI